MQIKVPKENLALVNQIFEIERKLARIQEPHSIQRNIDKIKEYFEESGLFYENPLGQKYDETRTDCEASIAGEKTENLIITEVIKPLIRLKKDGLTIIVQRAVVIVSAKN